MAILHTVWQCGPTCQPICNLLFILYLRAVLVLTTEHLDQIHEFAWSKNCAKRCLIRLVIWWSVVAIPICAMTSMNRFWDHDIFIDFVHFVGHYNSSTLPNCAKCLLKLLFMELYFLTVYTVNVDAQLICIPVENNDYSLQWLHIMCIYVTMVMGTSRVSFNASLTLHILLQSTLVD